MIEKTKEILEHKFSSKKIMLYFFGIGRVLKLPFKNQKNVLKKFFPIFKNN